MDMSLKRWRESVTGQSLHCHDREVIKIIITAIRYQYEDMAFMVGKLLEEYEKWGLKINLEKNFYMGFGAETKDKYWKIRKVPLEDVKNFKVWVKIDKEDGQEKILRTN